MRTLFPSVNLFFQKDLLLFRVVNRINEKLSKWSFRNKKTRTIYPGFTTIRPTTFFLYLETFLGCSFKFSGKVGMIHKLCKLPFPIGPPFFPTGLAKVPMKNVFLLIIFFVTVFLLSRDLIWRYRLRYQEIGRASCRERV